MADSDRIYDIVGVGPGLNGPDLAVLLDGVEEPVDAAILEPERDFARYQSVLLEATTHTVSQYLAENRFVERAPSASRQRGSEPTSTTDDHR